MIDTMENTESRALIVTLKRYASGQNINLRSLRVTKAEESISLIFIFVSNPP